MKPFFMLYPTISHLSLVIALETTKENRKIAVKNLFTSATFKLTEIFSIFEKLRYFSNAFSILLILTIPVYSVFINSSSTDDFTSSLLAVLYGTSICFVFSAMFSFKTLKLLSPQLMATINQNEKRMETEQLNRRKLKRQIKLIKNILRQQSVQQYFSLIIAAYAGIGAAAGVPFQFVSNPIIMSVFAIGSTVTIAIPYLNVCYSRNTAARKNNGSSIRP